MIAGCRYNVARIVLRFIGRMANYTHRVMEYRVLILAILQFDEMSGSFAWEIICSHHSNYGLWLFISDDHRG